jgi:hypothetical protein
MEAKSKRKDLMDNIKMRLNMEEYNMKKYYKKNEKDLKEKVKFFEKKISTGEMRGYMMPRYEQARILLTKLQGLSGDALPPVKEASGTRKNKVNLAPNAVPALPEVKLSRSTRKKLSLSKSNLNYFNQASSEFLPLPELYDPFTGRKYHPDENPLSEIERAYFMLEDIIEKAKQRAKNIKLAARRPERQATGFLSPSRGHL